MNILFLGPQKSTFVKNDFEILSKYNKIIPVDTNVGGGIRGAFNLLKCTLKSIKGLLKSDLVFVWFADYSSLIPVLFAKILGKKSVVVAGGFDVGYLPELNYGAKARAIRWFCVKNTFKYAKQILPVSNYAMKSLLALTGVNPKKVDMLYNCIKSSNYNLEISDNSKRQHFITVSQAGDLLEFVRKGNDRFIETAKQNPKFKFVLAGLRGSALDKAIELGTHLDNLEIIPGPISLYNDILPLYSKAFGYFQLSIEETFGLAVIEAMKCGCVPIVSPNAALPEVAGKHGVIVQTDEEISRALNNAVSIDLNKRLEFSKFADKYDIANREIKIIELLNK